LITRLLEVVIDSVLSILAREFAGDDRFGFQTEPLFRTRLRSALK
jgi:hypothetical protein